MLFKIIRIFGFLFCFISFSSFSKEVLKPADSYNFDRWSSKNGLPQNSINNIIQSHDGYLWLATSGGLVRFDGVNFKLFNKTNLPLLKTNRVRYLFETQNGDIIIIANGSSMIVYSKGIFHDFSNGKEVFQFYFDQENKIYESGEKYWIGEPYIEQDRNNILYLCITGRGIVAIDPITYQKIPPFKFLENSKYSLFKSDEYGLVFSNGKNLFVQNKGWKSIGILDSTYFIGDWHDSKNNCTWSVKGNLLIQYQKGKKIKQSKIPEIFWKDRLDIVWSSTNDFLSLNSNFSTKAIRFKIEMNEFSIINNTYKTEIGKLNQVLNDIEGNSWHATSIGGLFKEKPQRFVYFDKDENLPSHNFYPIVKAKNGNIFIGTFGADYFEFDAEGTYIPKSQKIIKQLKNSNINDLELIDNSLYLSTIDLILQIKNDEIIQIKFPDERFSEAILYKTKNNELLVGTYNKVFYFKNNKFTEHPINKKSNFEKISYFYEDDLNTLWVISDIGIFNYDHKTQSLKTYKLNSNNRPDFRGFYEDSDHRIYIGSYGNGLSIIENEKVFSLSINNGLFENVVSTITEDKSGNIWLTGNKGLTRISKKEVLEILKGKQTILNAVLYNEETDDIRTSEFNGGGQHNKCWLGDEVYLFPTLNGCVKIDFAKFKPNLIPPRVHIENILIGDSLFSNQAKIEIPYSESRLEILFTALSFVAPSKNRFKYMLEGYDKDWINAQNEKNAYYNKLPPGNYTFKVIACNNEGVWNDEGDSIKITIKPLFYQRLGFKILLAFTVILLVILITLRIVGIVKKRDQEKSALTDILPDLVLNLDKDGKYLDFYGNATLLILPFNQLKGKYIKDFLTKELAELVMEKIKRSFELKVQQQFEYNLELSDGIIHYFEGRIIAKGNNEIILFTQDITQKTLAQLKLNDNEKMLLLSAEKEKKLLKKINQQQKLQLEAIINTEEKERKRIATDLHDGIGQLLSSVKINLAILEEKINLPEDDLRIKLLTNSKSSILQITDEIRNISYNLLPPSLEQFGLASAMEEEIKKLDNNTELKFTFYHSLNHEKFESKIEVVLFRSFQEIVNNILKHARATEVSIQLLGYEDEIVLMIEDNGIGFDYYEAIQKKNSSGLKNLFSRVMYINGKLKIDSNPNAGTSIIITIKVLSI